MLTLEDLGGAQAEDTAAETWPQLPVRLLDVKGRTIPLDDNLRLVPAHHVWVGNVHGSCVARARPSARCRCRTRAGGQPTGACGGTGGSNLNYFTYGLINKHLYLLYVSHRGILIMYLMKKNVV